jgi:error-prone DNA polymerase
VSGISTGPGRYCELHAHSCFSLLDGVPFPEELARWAAELGLPALALTDHDALYGLVPFYKEALACGVKPIVGAELTLEDGADRKVRHHLTLLAETQAGYGNLCQLITLGRANAPKGEARLPWVELPRYARGLICLTGCRKGVIPQHLATRDFSGARLALEQLVDFFGPGQVYVEVQRNLRRDDIRLSRRLVALANECRVGYVATGNVHYLTRADADVQDVLTCLRERLPLAQADKVLRPNHEYYLRSAAEMAALYTDLPEALAATLEIAGRCQVALPSGLQTLPTYPTPSGVSAIVYLRHLCKQALPRLYPRRSAEAAALLEKELGLIDRLRLANYFLVVWDIVTFCREQGILCHGRGSAANSLVAHLLGISAVDPLAQALVLERFISVEHGGTPDIDLDIDAARRERVIQYVYARWGRDHAAMACTYITYRPPSALRDAGYALGFKPEVLAEIAQEREAAKYNHDDVEGGEFISEAGASAPPAPVSQRHQLSSPEWQRLTALAERLRGRPRHLGLHNGGMIIAGDVLSRLIPLEPASMDAPGARRTVVQFDKTYLEDLGIVKVDLLGLRMLSAISDTVQLARGTQKRQIHLERLPFDDRRVYAQICTAQTIGIFQVESGAQVSVIPHLQPRCFQDLVIEVSLIRPGPLQGNMVRPYLRRRQGLEPVCYPHPLLKPALAETLGVLVFQEQVIKVARDVAGFSPGRGELLRRALGHKDAAEALGRFRGEFLEGALGRGVTLPIAEQIWGLIENFAGYSFSKAHAAAFAVLVYWSAWLRVYYPTEYFCGLLRNSPLGTYPAHVLESEARRVGVKFLSFDINRSLAQATVEVEPKVRGAIRHGLATVKGLGLERADALIAVRGRQPFGSLADFIRRTKLDRRTVEYLVLAGAFDTFGERRQVLWDLAEAFEIAHRPPALPLDVPDEQPSLLPMAPEQKLAVTFAATGVTAGLHLVELRRDAFTRAGCLPFRQLWKMRNGAKVRVGGLVADGLRRPPTAKGVGFLRLDMPEGLIDVVVSPEVFERCREALHSAFLVVEGTLRKQPTTLTVTAERILVLA